MNKVFSFAVVDWKLGQVFQCWKKHQQQTCTGELFQVCYTSFQMDCFLNKDWQSDKKTTFLVSDVFILLNFKKVNYIYFPSCNRTWSSITWLTVLCHLTPVTRTLDCGK